MEHDPLLNQDYPKTPDNYSVRHTNGIIRLQADPEKYSNLPKPTPAAAYIEDEVENYHYIPQMSLNIRRIIRECGDHEKLANTGFIIPVGAEIQVTTPENTADGNPEITYSPDGFPNIDVKVHQTAYDNGLYEVPTLWIPQLPENFVLLLFKPVINSDTDYDVPISVYDPEKEHGGMINVPLEVKKTPLKIKYATPLVQALPIHKKYLNLSTKIHSTTYEETTRQ